MGEPAMQLGDAELSRIGGYVKDNLRQWISEVAPTAMSPALAPPDPIPNAQLLERMVRVEEELKAQRELFLTRFEAVDRRFGDMNTRFGDMNTRFEDMNTRFEDMKDYLNKRFNVLTWMIGLLTTVVVAVLGLSIT
jgi:uncharacterized membrane protein